MTGTTATIDPTCTALLVMDYQQGIVARLPDAGPLLARTAEAIATIRRRGGHVGYVRIGFQDADYDAIPAHSRMAASVAAAGRAALRADAPATAISGQLAPQPGDILVRKTRVGAFSTTDLDQQLRERGITTLILAGIATSGVVLTTIREAADRDYQLHVLSDACADPDPDVHAFLIQKIFPRQAQISTVTDLETL